MGVTNLDSISLATPLTYIQDYALFSSGAQTTGTKKGQVLIPAAGTIVGVSAYIDTAPVGATFILDVNINGTTAFTTQANRPTIADGGNASTTTLPDVVAVAAGDRISYDVDQVGSGTAGSTLTVTVRVRRNAV